MAIGPKLEFKQSQQLVMTPQLQQAIKLLQLSNIELTEYVQDELLSNPILEESEAAASDASSDVQTDEEPAPEVPDPDAVSADLEPSELDRIEDQALNEEGFGDGNVGDELHELQEADVAADGDIGALPAADENPLDTNVDEAFEPDAPEIRPDPPESEGDHQNTQISESKLSPDSNLPDRQAALTLPLTLQSHLLAQLEASGFDADRKLICRFLIDAIDDAGYLSEQLADIADDLDANEEAVEEALKAVQSFDPTGVGARSLLECLSLQLEEKDRLDPVMQIFLDNISLMAAGDLKEIKSVCGVDDEDLAEMIADIKALDPKPGLQFDNVTIEPMIPDVFVRRNAEGYWIVELNDATLPKVIVNNEYYSVVKDSVRSDADKQYLAEKFNTANWLVKSLDQRARTILRVSEELVRQQSEFLDKGVQFLKPLTLRNIAAMIDMHESTVSRVTSNKFMATPRGTFEMKYFFTPAIQAVSGAESHSAEAVRARIRDCIEAEVADKVLSDDKIVAILRESGVDIARRTVAKYREAMDIPSSVERRRAKRQAERERALSA